MSKRQAGDREASAAQIVCAVCSLHSGMFGIWIGTRGQAIRNSFLSQGTEGGLAAELCLRLEPHRLVVAICP